MQAKGEMINFFILIIKCMTITSFLEKHAGRIFKAQIGAGAVRPVFLDQETLVVVAPAACPAAVSACSTRLSGRPGTGLGRMSIIGGAFDWLCDRLPE
jgi:hypothetical protein